jgi:hypothetical protein
LSTSCPGRPPSPAPLTRHRAPGGPLKPATGTTPVPGPAAPVAQDPPPPSILPAVVQSRPAWSFGGGLVFQFNGSVAEVVGSVPGIGLTAERANMTLRMFGLVVLLGAIYADTVQAQSANDLRSAAGVVRAHENSPGSAGGFVAASSRQISLQFQGGSSSQIAQVLSIVCGEARRLSWDSRWTISASSPNASGSHSCVVP